MFMCLVILNPYVPRQFISSASSFIPGPAFIFFYFLYANREISLAEISRPFSRDCTSAPRRLALIRIAAALSLSPTTLRIELLRHSAVHVGLVALQPQTPMPMSSARAAKPYRSAHSGRIM